MEQESPCSSSSAASLSNLLCRENEESILNKDGREDLFFSLSNIFVTENEDEYIQMLIQRENPSSQCFSFDGFLMNKDWLKHARFDAIQWILKTRAFLGFCFQTAYLSITYFDQFLSKRSIEGEKIWAIRLLSVACLTLAAKMEECGVPPLSEFRIDDYNFENKVIQRMELLVLNTLEWKMASITPLAYIHYFITKLSNNESRFKDLVSRTVDHVLAFVKEMNIMDQRASSIAVAAIFAASDKGLTTVMLELKMSALASCGTLQNDEVFSCYNQMLELEMAKNKTPMYVLSPDLSSIHSSSTGVLEDSLFTSSSRSKRRRLTFNDIDPTCDMLNEKGLQ